MGIVATTGVLARARGAMCLGRSVSARICLLDHRTTTLRLHVMARKFATVMVHANSPMVSRAIRTANARAEIAAMGVRRFAYLERVSIRLLRIARRRSGLLSVRCTLPSPSLAAQRSRRLLDTLYRNCGGLPQNRRIAIALPRRTRFHFGLQFRHFRRGFGSSLLRRIEAGLAFGEFRFLARFYLQRCLFLHRFELCFLALQFRA